MPDVTIGICAYNEVANIGKSVKSAFAQKLDGFTLVGVTVVSSGSTDGTDEAVIAMQKDYPKLKLISQTSREGKNSALNCFLEDKGTELVAILNADNVFGDENSLQKLLEPLLDEKVGIVGGHPVPTNSMKTVADVASHTLWTMHHHVSLVYPKIGELIAFRDIGIRLPVHNQSDEDLLKMGLEKEGYESAYAPDAIVLNRGPENIRDFFKQRVRVNIGEYNVKKHNDFYIATQDWRILASALLSAIKEVGRKPFHLLACIVMEVYARIYAKYYVSRDRGDMSIWEPIESTKKV